MESALHGNVPFLHNSSMRYIEVSFKVLPLQPASEILVAELGDLDFESFVEQEDGLLAYIQEENFDVKLIKNLFVIQSPEFQITFSYKAIEDQNWNAKWESEYEPVLIENRCYIHAPFHPERTDVEFNILIEPKMSFGTAHHETTYQMIQLLMDTDVTGKSVLDMGSGTAVLAILAKMKNAATVYAIDNDEWAFNNALENVKRNHFPDIVVELGDANSLIGKKFKLVIANINKNILLRDMPFYVEAMEDGAQIFFSGFYEHDLDDIKAKAESLGLKYQKHLQRNNWVAAVFAL